ncbi:MAG: hypothetical protein WD928_17035 [Gammaproteobacteria bacterium]
MAACNFARADDNTANRLTIAAIDGGAWRSGAVTIEVDWAAPSGPALQLRAASVTLPPPLGRLDGVQLNCSGVRITAQRLHCPAAQVRAVRADGTPLEFMLDLAYAPASGLVQVDVPRVAIADGTLAVHLEAGAGVPRLEMSGTDLALSALPAWGDFVIEAGTATFDLEWRGDAQGVVEGTVAVDGLAIHDASGRIATEDLDATTTFSARRDDAGAWRGRFDLGLVSGGVYVEPVFIDLAVHPLSLRAAAVYRAEEELLEFADFSLEQKAVLALDGTVLRVRDGQLESVTIERFAAYFPGAYDAWLAGFLVGTPLASLDIGGKATGRIVYDDGRPQALDVVLERVNAEDRDGRFALYGLAGEIHWAAYGAALDASSVHFDGGHFHGAGFDGATLVLGVAGAAMDLLEPARIPLLGGALVIETFTLRDYASAELALGFEASLEPIELGQLTLALDWPAFAGTLEGRLPLLEYHDGVLTVGGKLEARAFDGDITVEDLRIEQPLGLVPELGATIRLRNIDLARLTEIVPFGRVTGRIDGDIVDLRMLKGEPVSFDARLQSTADDDSRRRLSQRAVDTIARVAGGGAVLSTTFLRIFKNFAYKQLGIACRLENDICHMDGVAPAEDGYYIVEGAFLPRIDLIGRVRTVHWSRLMAQLEEALAEGEIVID